MNIGRGIRRAREIAGLTVEGMAERTSFGVKYLSMMEAGDGSDALLRHIAGKYAAVLGFPTDMVALLGAGSEDLKGVTPEVATKLAVALTEMLTSWEPAAKAPKAKVESYQIAPDALPRGTRGVSGIVLSEGERQTALLAFEAGGVLGADVHYQREVGVVLRGSVELQREGRPVVLYGRDVPGRFQVRPGTSHSLIAGTSGALVASWWSNRAFQTRG